MPPETIDVRSYYMTGAHDDNNTMVYKAEAALEDVDYDTMVGTGLSGSLVVPVLARALDKHWLVMRKPSDGTHSDAPGEGTLGERWIFVDDFVASGDTRKRVRGAVKQLVDDRNGSYVSPAQFTTTFVGSYLYRGAGNFVEAVPPEPVSLPDPIMVEIDAETIESSVRLKMGSLRERLMGEIPNG